MTAKASIEQTSDGEGVEVLKNEPYDDGTSKGQYTHKIIHISSYVNAITISSIIITISISITITISTTQSLAGLVEGPYS